jgi:hypothetical protein
MKLSFAKKTLCVEIIQTSRLHTYVYCYNVSMSSIVSDIKEPNHYIGSCIVTIVVRLHAQYSGGSEHCKHWNFRKHFIFTIFMNAVSNANIKDMKDSVKSNAYPLNLIVNAEFKGLEFLITLFL